MIEFIHIAQAAETANSAAEEAKSGGVLELLGINWKLFVAQLVNFGIVLFVLWKWFFTPVTNALQNRAKKIDASLKDAEEVKKQVAELEKFRKEQKEQARQEYGEIITKAESAAGEQKTQILAEAKLQSKKLISDAEARINSEKTKMISDVKTELASLVVAATERVLKEKLDAGKDSRLIKESLSNLK